MIAAKRFELVDRFKTLIKQGKTFATSFEMQCITILIHLTNREAAENRAKYNGLNDEEIVDLIRREIEEENQAFKKIKQETEIKHLRDSAIKNLLLNAEMLKLVKQHFHN